MEKQIENSANAFNEILADQNKDSKESKTNVNSSKNVSNKKEIKKNKEQKTNVLKRSEIETGKKLKEISENEIFSKLKNLSVSDKVRGKKDFIYLFQVNEKIDIEEQKKRRSKIRRQLTEKSESVLLQFKKVYELKNEKDKENLQKSIFEFFTFYNENYISKEISKETFASLDEVRRERIFILIDLIKHEINKVKNEKITKQLSTLKLTIK